MTHDSKKIGFDVRKFTPNVSGNSDVGIGVSGTSNSGMGVTGMSTSDTGVYGVSSTAEGVWGESTNGEGVHGETHSQAVAAIAGFNRNRDGTGAAIYGKKEGEKGQAGFFVSDLGEGVHAETHSPKFAAIAGFNLNPEGTGAAIYGKKEGVQGHAGFFEGNVMITGDLCFPNADCAEDFDIAEAGKIEPGTVMVLDQEGALQPSQKAYDKRVAGVISGAGDYRPGIVLDKQQSSENRMPVALVGKVYCKVDAQYAPIEVGDLLTTSPTLGHAMKADDPFKAFGSVIGKALQGLQSGQGLVPILVALQ